ncbi:MAG: queuosine precursor transporter, partial [Saprospiraceae bacterium]
PVDWTIMGQSNLSFNLSAGILLWPVVFVMTDIINEYYGTRGVKFLSYLTVFLISYGFIMYFFAIGLEPADFWVTSHLDSLPADDPQRLEIAKKVGDYDFAYQLVFGQGLWIIIGSITAFLIAQIIDVTTFHRIKKATGEDKIWLRATGSTLISQLVDTFVVAMIAFYIGANWDLITVVAICIVGYSYKFIVAIVMTPVIYLAHYLIDQYLGEELSTQMKMEAAQ